MTASMLCFGSARAFAPSTFRRSSAAALRQRQPNNKQVADASSLWFRRTSTVDLHMSATAEAPAKPYDALNRERGLESYDPSAFETEIYKWWESSGCFKPPAKKVGEKDAYVIPMPPPNVTGRLHMGHAIFVALQDVLARFHRMRGRPVLWLPGTDHAGIATQLQVEKQLLAEGTTREEVGREEFLRRVWEYKEEQGGHIQRQLRSLGASADWSRERFTMDSDLSESVAEAFVRLHEKGLVYRGEYMVNWAPLLKTAVSDLEVEYSEEEGKLYYFKYMIEDSEGKCSSAAPVAVGPSSRASCSLSTISKTVFSFQNFSPLPRPVPKPFVEILRYVFTRKMSVSNT